MSARKPDSIWRIVLPLLISTAALFVSFLSYQASKKALDQSVRSFIIESRPYVVVQPMKFSETGQFLKCTRTEEGILLETLFEMRNVGKVPAEDISLGTRYIDIRHLGNSVEQSHVSRELKPCITLGPGQSHTFEFFMEYIRFSDDQQSELICEAINNKNKSVSVKLSLFYTSSLCGEKEFSTDTFHYMSKYLSELKASKMK